MKHLTFVILISGTLLASLFSGATPGSSLEPLQVVRVSEESLDLTQQTQSGFTNRVSVASNDIQGNEGSSGGSISAAGRYVTFTSWASNLVSSDTSGVEDIFLHHSATISSSIYLPIVPSFPTYLFVKKSTTGAVSYTVYDTPQGDITCSIILSEFPVFCGKFTPGTYRVSVSSTECGTTGSVTFPSGAVTREVSEESCRINFFTSLYIKNNTTGVVSYYTVYGTPEGNITCSNIPAGATAFCGHVTPGTYTVSVNSTECGVTTGSVTFPPADVTTREVSCPPSTQLYIKNSTRNVVFFYAVFDTPQGNIVCSNIPAGATVLCGKFTSGTYRVSVSTAQCGDGGGSVIFPPGNVTRVVRCVVS
jgi:hypothetical protein